MQAGCLSRIYAVNMWYTDYTEYNPGCQVKRSVHMGTYPFEYTYDLAGELIKEKYPSNREVHYEYSTGGKLGAVCNGPCASHDRYAHNLAYDQFDLPTAMPMGNGITQRWDYNSLLQPTWIRATNSGGGNILAVVNNYTDGSNNGNIAWQTSNGATMWVDHDYTYDGLNRLTQVAQDGSWTEGYSYDRYGNRAVTTRTQPLAGWSGEMPNGLNWYNTATNRIGSFTYDARGNITATPTWTANYDGENRQISALRAGGSWRWFGYDGENRRIAKTDGTNWTIFLYDAFGRLAAEHDGTNYTDHIYGLGHLATESAAGRLYYTNDHLGSTRMITDGSGNRLSTPDYLPFGEEVSTSGCTALEGGVKFTGQYRDQESCLDYFMARYMSPAQGRFNSPDLPFADQYESDPQSWNLYAYGRNNPLKYTDPTGRRVTIFADYGGYGQIPYTVENNDYWFQADPGMQLPHFDFNSPYSDVGDIYCSGIYCGWAHYEPDPGTRRFAALGDAGQATTPIATGVGVIATGVTIGLSITNPISMAMATCMVEGCQKSDILFAALPGGKAINFPAWRRVTVAMAHIAERHMPGGAKTSGRDIFLNLNGRGAQAAIEQAYGTARIVQAQGDRVLLEGVTKTGMTVQMWFNKATNTIETAYPVGKQW